MGRFLRLTGLTAGGFLSLTAPLAPRVVVAAGAAGWDRLSAAGCVEGLCSLRSRGRYRRFAAMSMKTTLRDFLLCHQCCMTECVSPLPADWYLWALRLLTTCTKILHCVQNDGAGKKVPPQAAEDRGVSSFQNLSDLSSALSGSSFLRKEPNVTTFPLVSPVPHDEEPEPPSTGRGWRR